MKLCDTCIYQNENEYHKPCIVYRDDCKYYEKERGDMTREEAISIMNVIIHMLEPKYDTDRVEEAVDMAIKALEQEPCEGEYIKVPKKALKYRTSGMVAYNAEWLKNNFDIERAVICGTQQPCDDLISRQAVNTLVDELARAISDERCCMSRGRSTATIMQDILDLPSVNPQEPKWIPVSNRLPEPDIEVLVTDDAGGLATISTDSIYESEVTGEKDWYTSQNVTAWMPLPKPYKAESEE